MRIDTPTEVVTGELRGKIFLVTINHPPVDALDVDVRRGILAAIDEADADHAVEAVLIVGAGHNLAAEANIGGVGKPPQLPSLLEVCNRIEAGSKPVVAAIHGAALGGGLEIALAAHYRLAMTGATLGLSEVQLGLMPRAGGTQRAPRLIGAKAALNLMLSGRPVDAEEAFAQGLVDRLERSGDMLAEGLAYAQVLVATHAPVRRTRDASALADRRARQNRRCRRLGCSARAADGIGAFFAKRALDFVALRERPNAHCY